MLNDKFKISIVVPVYNLEGYLSPCLDSLINQTYKNLEIILVDDGSTDNSRDIIEDYKKKDSRIISLYKKNTGVSDTRNKGIDIASGDYIGFVDGDDFAEPEMFEHLLDNAIKYNADISHCGYQMVFPSHIDYYYNTGKLVVQDNKQAVIDVIKGEFIEPGIWNKLYKKSVLSNVRMPVDIRINEDFLFNVEAFKNAECSVYEDKPYYHYILRKGSAATSGVSEHKVFDGKIVRERICEIFKDDNEVYPYALDNLLFSCISIMRTMVVNKSARIYKKKTKPIKQDISRLYKECKTLGILSKRMKMDCLMIKYCPFAFNMLYKVYDLIFKTSSKYEVK